MTASIPESVLVFPDDGEIAAIVRSDGGTVLQIITGSTAVLGPYGRSAYDLAVEQGFEGSLDDYLNTLRGFILVGPGVDAPPIGTPDGTFVFQQV